MAPQVPRVRGRADYERLTPEQREARHRAFDALHEMRERGLSLRAAAQEAGTTPRTVRRYAGDALTLERGRYRPAASDRIYQRMSVLSTEGLVDVDTRGSRVRSAIGRHWNAIKQFAATGDVHLLAPFEGERVGGVELASDPDLIEEYLRRGEIDIDDIYL